MCTITTQTRPIASAPCQIPRSAPPAPASGWRLGRQRETGRSKQAERLRHRPRTIGSEQSRSRHDHAEAAQHDQPKQDLLPAIELAGRRRRSRYSRPPALPSQTASRQPGRLWRSQSRNTTARVTMNTNARRCAAAHRPTATSQACRRPAAGAAARHRVAKTGQRKDQEGECQQPVAGPLEAGEALDGHAAPSRLDGHATAQNDEDKQEAKVPAMPQSP